MNSREIGVTPCKEPFPPALLKVSSLVKEKINGTVYILDGESNGTPLQYSCLENPMDRGAW